MAVTKYSDADKLAICADWALMGDDHAVSTKHGVKIGTLKKWRQSAWWRETLETMHSQNSQRLIAKANRAMDTALDELQERVELGDVRCLLKGETVVSYREPVKARDLSSVINVLATRSEKAASLSSQTLQTYQLADLQTSFRQFAASYRAKPISNGLTIDHGAVEHDQNGVENSPVNGQEQDNRTDGMNGGIGGDRNASSD